MKAERPRSAAVLRSVQGTADPELHGALGIDQALLDGAFAPGAVRVSLAPVAIPGVGVRVEVDQAHRPISPGDRAQLAERDAVVAADRERDDPGVQDRPQSVDDHLIARLDVARNDREVTRVNHRKMVEDFDLLLDVVGAEQARGLANGGRSEAAADAVADAGVEWNAHDRRIDPVHIANLRQPHEAADAGEARRDHRVDRPGHEQAPTRPPSCSPRG